MSHRLRCWTHVDNFVHFEREIFHFTSLYTSTYRDVKIFKYIYTDHLHESVAGSVQGPPPKRTQDRAWADSLKHQVRVSPRIILH